MMGAMGAARFGKRIRCDEHRERRSHKQYLRLHANLQFCVIQVSTIVGLRRSLDRERLVAGARIDECARVSLAVGIENVCGSLSRPIAVDLLLVLGRPFALCQGQVLGGQHKERCGRIRIAG
jgi:hypothetical protein